MSSPSPAHNRDLKSSLADFHKAHAETYGPYETCKDDCCVEGRMAIAWLESRQAHTSLMAPTIMSANCSALFEVLKEVNKAELGRGKPQNLSNDHQDC